MQEFQVEGMTCGHCERAVADAILRVDPGAKVDIDRAEGRARVHSAADPATIAAAIAEEGYTATPLAG